MNYKLNEASMFADITDGTAIVINSLTGIYYGMNGFGTEVFDNLLSGSSSEEVLQVIMGLPDKERTFHIARTVLCDEGRAEWYASSRLAYRLRLPFIRLSDKFRAGHTFRRHRIKLLLHHLKDAMEKRGCTFPVFLYNKVRAFWVHDQ